MDIFFFFFQNDTDSQENELVPQNTGYVFISHSSKDKDSANAIRNILAKNGIASWMAPIDIPAGSTYAKEISTAIKNCACFLLLLTNNSQSSKWVPRETERAIHYVRPLIPVQLEDVTLEEDFELYLSTSQILPMKNFDENSCETQKLVQIIKAHTGLPNKKN